MDKRFNLSRHNSEEYNMKKIVKDEKVRFGITINGIEVITTELLLPKQLKYVYDTYSILNLHYVTKPLANNAKYLLTLQGYPTYDK